MRPGADKPSRSGFRAGLPAETGRPGHLRHRRLQDRVALAGRKRGPRRTVVAVVGIRVGYPDALPLGELLEEGRAGLCHLADPPGAAAVALMAARLPAVCGSGRLRCSSRCRLRRGLARGVQFGALGAGHWRRLGRLERREA